MTASPEFASQAQAAAAGRAGLGYLAGIDPAQLPAGAQAELLRLLEQAHALGMDVIDVRTWTMHNPDSERTHSGPSSRRARAGYPPERSLPQQATALVASLTRQPWGQLSASVYETGRHPRGAPPGGPVG